MNILQIKCTWGDRSNSLSYPFTIPKGVRAPTASATKDIFSYLLEGMPVSINDINYVKFKILYSDFTTKEISYGDLKKLMN